MIWLVHHTLERAAMRDPDREFLVWDAGRASYAEIATGAERIARGLVTAGLERGDRVGILAVNSRVWVEAYYGALAGGGIAVPINAAADAATAAGILADCAARVLVVGRGLEAVAAEAIRSAARPDLVVVEDRAAWDAAGGSGEIGWDELAAGGASASLPALIDQDVAAIVYTSGSTGAPRGATLTHLNIVSNTRSIVSYLELTPDDRVLAILPFHYVYGMSLLNTHAFAGGAVVIENRFMFPATALETMARERCTGLSGVPSTFAILMNRSDFPRREWPHLRYVTQAGGPMSPELTRRLAAALGSARLFVMYGATEASARLSYLHPDELDRKLGSIGRPIPNVELRVLRPDGTEAAPGEVGEIVARGSNVMRGYWNAPEETRAVLDGHGYRTGDLGYRDEDGVFWITGRKKDMIKSGAHRISAKEIEDALVECEAVHEAAVIGVPDEILGEAIEAHVSLRPGASATHADIEAFAVARLPAYKRPRRVVVHDELPKNAAGKVMKRALVDGAASRD